VQALNQKPIQNKPRIEKQVSIGTHFCKLKSASMMEAIKKEPTWFDF
jgi:hypothetical protein